MCGKPIIYKEVYVRAENFYLVVSLVRFNHLRKEE